MTDSALDEFCFENPGHAFAASEDGRVQIEICPCRGSMRAVPFDAGDVQLSQAVAKAVKQLVGETPARIVRPAMRNIETEARLGVSVENDAKVGDSPAEALLVIHVFERQAAPKENQRVLAPVRVGMNHDVEGRR